MNTSSRRIAAFFAAGLASSLAACSGGSLLSDWATSSPRLPFDAIVVSPGERVAVDALPTEESHYYCSNGALLHCERVGLKLYCSCPRTP